MKFIFVVSIGVFWALDVFSQNLPGVPAVVTPDGCFNQAYNPYTAGLFCNPSNFQTYFLQAQPWMQQQYLSTAQFFSPTSFVNPLRPNIFLTSPSETQAPSQASVEQAYSDLVKDVSAKNSLKDDLLPEVFPGKSLSNCNCSSQTQKAKFNYPVSDRTVEKDLAQCRAHQIKTLPGSDEFDSHFMESISEDPQNPEILYGLTADLSSKVSPKNQAMYVSRSSDGGKTWVPVARINSNFFDASKAEGLYNHLAVSPGGSDLVFTSKTGAYHFSLPPEGEPGNNPSGVPDADLIPLAGPQGSDGYAQAVKIDPNPDSQGRMHMAVSYNRTNEGSQILEYHFDGSQWEKDSKDVPKLPTTGTILSLNFDSDSNCYMGSGDQAFRLDAKSKQWTKISGVGSDAAIAAISTTGGLHLATCGGVYTPGANNKSVVKAKSDSFEWISWKDNTHTLLRASDISVNPKNPDQMVVAAPSGVYLSRDGGKKWGKMDLEGFPSSDRYATAHIDAKGTVVVSGDNGTYVAKPFAKGCSQ
jgi:hypothetical protein